MFLSDKLYEIGKSSNPKNNLSQGEAFNKMVCEIKKDLDENKSVSHIFYVWKFVCDKLSKEGYSYFKINLLFDDKKNLIIKEV